MKTMDGQIRSEEASSDNNDLDWVCKKLIKSLFCDNIEQMKPLMKFIFSNSWPTMEPVKGKKGRYDV